MQILLIGLLLFSFSANAQVENLEDKVKASCESLGYSTLYNDCISAGGMPLLCPFYTKENPYSACLIRSCRGYGLTENDLKSTASDGKKLQEHIEVTDECTVGYGKDITKYYRVGKCKDGSLYQNGVCDVGCSATKYPYDKHPGTMAGAVENCIDEKGEWFGYTSCNEGWVLSGAKCNLGSCSLTEYPYSSDPNVVENRGATLTCNIGKNTYYRYTAQDKEGNALTSGTCSSMGYTLNRGVCSKNCEFDNCTSTLKNVNNNGYTYSYNEWSCRQKTSNCRVGDYAVIGGQRVGIVAHLGTSTGAKTIVMSTTRLGAAFGSGEAAMYTIPLLSTDWSGGDQQGNYNTKTWMAWARGNSTYDYPLINQINSYSSANCSHDICQAGEWYLYGGGELSNIYFNRYIVYHATGDSTFTSEYKVVSSQMWGNYVYCVLFSGGGTGYYTTSEGRGSWRAANPIISFTLK